MKLIETYSLEEEGYKTLFSFNSWRVAMLNFEPNLKLETISYLEAHNKTDEAFILLNGSCTLILGVMEDDKLVGFEFEKLEPNKVYNVPLGIYHSHVLDEDAKILLVEEKDTGDENSVRIYLDEELKEMMRKGWESNGL